jgi:hypothetical protein
MGAGAGAWRTGAGGGGAESSLVGQITDELRFAYLGSSGRTEGKIEEVTGGSEACRTGGSGGGVGSLAGT